MIKTVLKLCFVAAAIVPVGAQASLLYGVLNATGTAKVSLGSIAFVDNALSINSPASAQEGGFTALAGTSATIQNITNPPDATGPLDVPDFIKLTPTLSITLTDLVAGIDGAGGCSLSPAAAGQVCTPDVPAESPYNLANLGPHSSFASFEVLGVEVDSTTGDTVPVVGVFTQPFSNESFQQLEATVQGGGTITTSFSAQFSTIVPEPSTWVGLMMGMGTLGFCAIQRKRSKKA